MNVSESFKIGARLVLAMALISITFACTKYFGHIATSKASNIASYSSYATDSTAKSLNGKTVAGDQVADLVTEYGTSVPILLVTGELYANGQGYSYNCADAFNKSAPEYVNSKYKYRVEVNFNDDHTEVIWIRIVQSELLDRPDLATISSTQDAFAQAQNLYKTKQELLQVQLATYQHK